MGSTVQVDGLSSKPELNGKKGTVRRYARDRIGVELDGVDAIALKPERLTLVTEAATQRSAEPERTPEAKEEEASRKKSRKEDLRYQDLRRFANVLLDSVK